MRAEPPSSGRHAVPRGSPGRSAVERVEGCLPEIVREAMTHARQRVTEVRDAADRMPEMEENVTELARGLILGGVDGVRRPDTPSAASAASAFAQEASRRGLPLTVSLAIVGSTVEVVHAHLWDALAADDADGPSLLVDHPLRGMSQATLSTLEWCLAGVYAAYADGEARIVGFVRRLLEGALDERAVEAEARRVGLDAFGSPFLLLAVSEVSGERADVERAAAEYLRHLGQPSLPPVFFGETDEHGAFSTLVVTGSDGCSATSSRIPLEDAARTVGVTVVIAHAETANALSDAFRDVCRVLDLAPVAERQAFDRRVFTLRELAPLLGVAILPRSMRDRELGEVLGPLLLAPPDKAARDLATLRAVCANPDATHAEIAALLGCSRGAARYRIKRIEARTGLSFPRDLFELTHALHLYEVCRDDLPPPGDPAWERRPTFGRPPPGSG